MLAFTLLLASLAHSSTPRLGPLEQCQATPSILELETEIEAVRQAATEQSVKIDHGIGATCTNGRPDSQKRAAELNQRLSGVQGKIVKERDRQVSEACKKALAAAMQENEKAIRALYEKSESQHCK